MSKNAVIDIGSNSILMLIGEFDNTGTFKKLLDADRVPRLGKGLKEGGRLNKASFEAAVEVIREYAALITDYDVENVTAVGTMAMRKAGNSADLIKAIKDESEIDVEVISGKEEARLSFLSVYYGLDFSDEIFAAIDVGGGSTEFVTGRNRQIKERFSANTGAVQILEDHYRSDPVTKKEFENGILDINKRIQGSPLIQKENKLVGIGGTITNLASIKLALDDYDPDIVHNSILNRDELEGMIGVFMQSKIEEIKLIKGLQPDRADVILSGASIVDAIMEKTGHEFITVSDWGLRHALMFERYG